MKKVRTRFAPSPTGYMHVGGIRTALYAYLIAKKDGGDFLLRIEDTDQKREVKDATQKLMDALKKAGISWDEGPDIGGSYGPYIQSERLYLYLPFAEKLVEMGKAYYCFCSQERLEGLRNESEAKGEVFKYDKHCLSIPKEEAAKRVADGENHVIRLNIPEQGKAGFDDVIFGHIDVDTADLDDIILIKSDGFPTYNFANVIDDHLMEITHVVRGSEFLSSTPKYTLLYEAFGWEAPKYIHLSPVMADSSRKLSKRHGDPTFEDLLEEGYLPEAIVNYIALLGWSPGDEREIFGMEELKEAFGINGLSKSPAIFDKAKLTWMNSEYIKKLDAAKFHKMILPYMKEVLDADKFDTLYIAELLQPRCEVLPDIMEKIDFLEEMPEYSTDLYFHKKMKTDAGTAKPVLEDMIGVLSGLEDWTVEGIRGAVAGYIEQKEYKNGFVLWPLRIAISGKESTPGGAYEIAYLLGREETLARLRKSASMIG